MPPSTRQPLRLAPATTTAAALLLLLLLAAAPLRIAAAPATAHSDPQHAPEMSWRPPSFCGALPCPHYATLRRCVQFEWRRLSPATWVATNISAMHHYEDAVQQAGGRLFKYLWGHNQEVSA